MLNILSLHTPFYCATSTYPIKQRDDINASLQNGVLTLRIYCGKPFDMDDETDVPITFF